jgi:hypothetical protein
MEAVYPLAARADASAHPPRQVVGQQIEARLERRKERRIGGIGRLANSDEHVGQHVHGVAQRDHVELDRHGAELLDGPRSTGVAPPDERDGFAAPFNEGGVHRVLEHLGVPVVVHRGEQHVAVGPIGDLAEAADRLVGVVPPGPGRRFGVERTAAGGRPGPPVEIERVVAGQPLHDPGRQLAEQTFPGGPGDLQEHAVPVPS